MTSSLRQQFGQQQFTNGHQLLNGGVMHAENPENFHIPPEVIKRHARPGQFVELRIDSPRLSAHEDASEKCSCPSCNGELTKPILRHDHPASLVPLPSRRFRHESWIRAAERSGVLLKGAVDEQSLCQRVMR